MRFLFLCLILTQSVLGYAQPGFNRVYNFGGIGCAIVNGILKDDTILLCAGLRNATTTPWGVALIKADTNGNIGSIHPYFDSLQNDLIYGTNYDIKLLPGGEIVFLGGCSPENARFLIKYNAAGQVILFKKIPYDNAYSVVTFDFESYKDGYIIGGTAVDQQNKFQPFLTRTDAEGNVLWTKRYPEPGRDQNSRCMKVLDENTIVIGSVLFNFSNQNWGKSRIFALDSLGNQKWDWRVPDTNEGIISDIHQMDNGDWLYLNKKFEFFSQDSVLSWSQLVRRDSNFNLIFTQRLSPTKWAANLANDLIPSPDGNWIISESTALVGPDFSWLGSSGWAGCLTKITSDGDILWQTCDTIHWNIPGVLSEETASGHVVLPSGSSILIGFTNRYKPSPARSFGWMFKVDANGCMMEPCSVGTEEEVVAQTATLRLYPNPASQTVQVEARGSLEAGKLSVFNSLGSLVAVYDIESGSQTKTVDVSMLASGLYFFRVACGGKLLFTEKCFVQH